MPTVFVALAQPDGDWDHLATLWGVYSTKEKADKRMEGAVRETRRVIEVEVDRDLDISGYA